MKLGMHLYELWRMRLALAASVLLAVFVSVLTAYKVSLLPPALHPRAMGMAAASTHVLVDAPHSVLLSPAVDGDQLDQMSQSALLLGNVMASLPVREYIARRAGIPTAALQMTSPITPQYPRPIADDPQNQRRTTDLFRSNDQYRINIKANPTVPILDIYTEASSVKMATALADAAVGGLRDYLNSVADSERVTAGHDVRLNQLGSAQAGQVTGGVNVEVAVLSFLFVFALSCAASLALARVARGWRESQRAANGALDLQPVDPGGDELRLADFDERVFARWPDEARAGQL
jgi:hypothetical protein